MKFAVSKGEKELSELTARLFEIRGRGAAERAKKAEATLLKANPHLSDLSKVPDGTLIVIPDLPDGPPVRAPQIASIGADIDEHLKYALKELRDAIDRSADSEEKVLAATTEALKSRELKDFARQSPELKHNWSKLPMRRTTGSNRSKRAPRWKKRR